MDENKIVYRVVVEYPGYDIELDRRLEKVIRREISGSGCCFGVRDLGWIYKKREAAYDASKKLRAKRIRGMRVFVMKYEI
jgi:hypothetical protein